MSYLGNLLDPTTDAGDINKLGAAPQLDANNPFTQQFNGQADQMMGYANPNAQAQSAQQQQAFVNALQAQASGQGPSVAGSMLNQALTNQTAQTNALAASQRGNANPALAMRLAMQNNANAGQSTAAQAAIARQQEQLNAQGMLGSALGQMRGQDLQNQQGMASLAQGYHQMGMGAAQANQNAQLGQNQINAGVAMQNTKNQNQMAGKVFDAVSGAGAMNSLGGGGGSGGAEGGAEAAGGGSSLAKTGMSLAMMSQGGRVPGAPQVMGDSPANDTVPAKLSPGEIVIPRSHATDSKRAKEFIDHLMKSQGKGQDASYAKVLEAHRKLHERVKKLEKKVK